MKINEAERSAVVAHNRAVKATAQRDAEYKRRADAFRKAHNLGVPISRLVELTGLNDQAIRKAIWPPDGIAGRYRTGAKVR